MIPDSEWVIQFVKWPRANDCNSRPRYLPWAGYTHPMRGDQAMWVLSECEAHWPAYEFRAHTINNGDETRFALPGLSADWTHPAEL